MFKLLKFEFRRLFRAKKLYFCTIFGVLTFLLTASLSGLFIGLVSLKGNYGLNILIKYLDFSAFFTIIVIFISSSVNQDFNYQILKNVYSKGYSKTTYFFCKYIVLLVGVIIMASVIFLSAFLHSKDIGFDKVEISKAIKLLLLQLIALVCFFTFCFTVALIFRKIGLTVFICIIVAPLIALALDYLNYELEYDKITFSDYWISQLIYPLQDLASTAKEITKSIVSSLIYTAVFMGLGVYLNIKKDL